MSTATCRGGGIVKRMKRMLELLPSNKQSADEIVHMAWFNPDGARVISEGARRVISHPPGCPLGILRLRRLRRAVRAVAFG
jgi:hypothetical protein